jgi:HEAT repeat protein
VFDKMNSMSTPSEIPFQSLLDALMDIESHFHPRYLYRLSDLEPEEITALQKAWRHIPLWRRQALMEDLEELGSANDLLSFEAIGRYAVSDEDPGVRNVAVRILWEFETADLAPLFLSIIETDSDADVRAAAASALGRFVYLGEIDELPKDILQDIEDRLLRLIQSDNPPQVRRCALESVSYSSRQEVHPLIEKAFSSGETEWMASALIAMGRSIDDRWVDDIISMLDSKFPILRAEAARAAGELEIGDCVPRLIELLDDSDERVRRAAIWSLSQIGGEGVREAIEDLLEETEDYEEADLLENALDNLAFTEDLQLYSLFDFSEEGVEVEMLDLLENEEDYLELDSDEDNEDMLD